MDMQIFENAQFGVIRAAEIDGEPWFVAKDVCDALEIGNAKGRHAAPGVRRCSSAICGQLFV